MDNREVRAFFEEIINLVNSFEDIPIEVKRLALFSAFQIVERQANEVIQMEQREALEKIKQKEEEDAEIIFEDKLGELSI